MAFGSIFLIIALVGIFTLALAFILDTQATKMRWQRRALYSACGGAFIPMVLPMVILLTELGLDEEFLIVFLSMIFGAVFLAAIVGFPISYWFCKRRDAARNPPNPESVFE